MTSCEPIPGPPPDERASAGLAGKARSNMDLTPSDSAAKSIAGQPAAGRVQFPSISYGPRRHPNVRSRVVARAATPQEMMAMTEHDRRAALASLAGVGLLIAGCAKQGADDTKKPDEEPVTANEDLMREHGVLRRILIVYREVAPKLVANAAAVDAAALAAATTLFQAFGERYHEQMLEEQHIFPIVRKAGGEAAMLIDALLAQHARGREITSYILDRTKSGRIGIGDAEPLARTLTAFARMYEPHAAREDTVIFPAFKKAVGPKGYDELGDQFEDIERRTFGGDGFDIAIDKVNEIEHRLGLADLAAFTAPAIT